METIKKINEIVNWWESLTPDFTGLNDLMQKRQVLSAYLFGMATDLATARKSLKNSIDALLRLNIFILEKNMFTTKERQEIKQKRAEYGRKGMQGRWGEKFKIKKPDSFIEQKTNQLETENFETAPTGDKLAELIKKAVSSRPVMPEVKKAIEEAKQDLQKIKPTRKKKPIEQDLGIVVSGTDFAEL
ncbi:unnamed protein product, partial [Rotaria socialis]